MSFCPAIFVKRLSIYWQFVSRDWVCVNALLKMSLQMILAIPIIALTFAYLATSYDSILSTPNRPPICTDVLLKIILALPIFTTAWNNWHILWIMIISHTHMTALMATPTLLHWLRPHINHWYSFKTKPLSLHTSLTSHQPNRSGKRLFYTLVQFFSLDNLQ